MADNVWLRAPRNAGTILWHAALRFGRDQGFKSSASLAYTTLLALVPLLTVVFAIFTAFPAYRRLRQQAETMLFQNLVPQVGDQVQAYAATFMAKAGAMTGLGVIGLSITAILLFFSIEGAFNAIWRATEPRPILTRLLSFWAVLTMAPLLLGASLSLGVGLLSQVKAAGWPGFTLVLAGVPMLLEVAAFTLLYMIVPNRDVGWKDALTGGLVASVLTETSKSAFSLYLTLFPTYEAIYGALSVVPIFLLWIYLIWSVVLFGAQVAATLPEWRAGRLLRHGGGLTQGQGLMVALGILDVLHHAVQHGSGLRLDAIARRVPVGAVLVETMLEQLRAARWVDRTAKGAWLLSRDLHLVTLADLRAALDLTIRGDLDRIGRFAAPWQPLVAARIIHAESGYVAMLNVSLATIFAAQYDPDAPAEAR